MANRATTRMMIMGWLMLSLACSHPSRMEEFKHGIGRLNQSELTRQFGYPQRLKRLSTGQEVWEYEFLSGRSRCVGYRVFFDEDGRSRKWEPQDCRSVP